jgi:hypothetical protein
MMPYCKQCRFFTKTSKNCGPCSETKQVRLLFDVHCYRFKKSRDFINSEIKRAEKYIKELNKEKTEF